MNNIEMLHILYLVTLVAAIVMLAVTAALFFVFRMWHVIGYLLGFSEKKAIKEMEGNTVSISGLSRRNGDKKKRKAYAISESPKDGQKSAAGFGGVMKPLQEAVPETTPMKAAGPATSPVQVSGGVETTPLSYGTDYKTVPLTTYSSDYHTGRLKPLTGAETVQTDTSAAQTAKLSAQGGKEGQKEADSAAKLQFVITRQIMYIHTEESI